MDWVVNRKKIDEWFPTVVRYFGIVLVFILAISTVLSNGHVEYPSLIVAATGMILYKTIRGSSDDNGNGISESSSGDKKSGSSKSEDGATAIKDEDDRAERWSHLE